MRCPACGNLLQQRKGRWVCPRCDYFKEGYESMWRKHKENVELLVAELRRRFPELSLRKGLGADSDEWIDIPPANKNELDIEGWWKFRHLFSVEVTGSDKVRVPPEDIWIRPAKLRVAEDLSAKGLPCLFWTVYPNCTYTLTVGIVATHRRSLVERDFKGKHEVFIAIPWTAGLPASRLFKEIESVLRIALPATQPGMI